MAFAVAVFGVVSQCATRPNLFRQSFEDRREVAGVSREVLIFIRPILLSTLYQSAIDFLSETLLWFGVRGVARMKICPNCQQQLPDGLQYCPNDTEHLIPNEEFVRRTRGRSVPGRSTP